MSRKEVPRAGLLKAALVGRITNGPGARALGLSIRQFRRLKTSFREAGARGNRRSAHWPSSYKQSGMGRELGRLNDLLEVEQTFTDGTSRVVTRIETVRSAARGRGARAG